MAVNKPVAAVVGAGAIALAAVGFTTASQLGVAPLSATTTTTTTVGAKGCNDWPGAFTDGECAATGFTLTALSNIQPAAQFCKWKAANPGEWNRLAGYASTGVHSSGIVTWLGGSLQNELEAYFGAHGPPFVLPRNPLPPNACGGKTLSPPIITGVTPGESDATITVAPPG